MKKLLTIIPFITLLGCSTEEVAQAQKARMFGKTGALAFYSGAKGFNGPILGPGTHYTGFYDELRKVDCTQKTQKESLQALTKDGVQFSLDIYIRFSIKCDSNEAVTDVLDKFAPTTWPDQDKHPEWEHVIFPDQMYSTYLRPAIGESVRSSVSPFIANEINNNREKIFDNIKTRFLDIIKKDGNASKHVTIFDINLSNLDFPDEMDHANAERATQSILKDKAIAEREKVAAEIETMKMKKELAGGSADAEAIRIAKVGEALRKNPEFMQFDLQQKMPEIYKNAGEKGNLTFMPAPMPTMLMQAPQKK